MGVAGCEIKSALSLPSRGAWIEIGLGSKYPIFPGRRSPHGERGLKFLSKDTVNGALGRSPHGERGLKYVDAATLKHTHRRSPHGERGLKYHIQKLIVTIAAGRSPHGERGLK